MRFRYEAIDLNGARSVGLVEAPGEPEAAANLRRQGLFPTGLVQAGARPSEAKRSAFPWPIMTSDRVLFLQQLALMLRSGLSLLGAFETLAVNASKVGLRRASARVAEGVREGRPLSAALEEQKLFPPLVPRLVSAAEATGELDQAFDRSAELIQRQADLRSQLVASLTYPTLVIVAASAVFVFLTTQVVPKFTALLSQRGVALPWTTQALMDLSRFLVDFGAFVGLGVALLIAASIALWRTRPGRKVMEGVLFRVPVLGRVLQAAAMAHLMRNLALMLRSGLPLLDALQVLAPTAPFVRFQDLILRARDEIVRGAPLARALEDPLFPAIGVQVVAVGEETGSLEEVTERLGEFYDERLGRLLRTLSSLVEPALLVVIGGMVGFVYFSFFQALFRVAAR